MSFSIGYEGMWRIYPHLPAVPLLAVEHRDADGSVHVITPRGDLESGKSLNISPSRMDSVFLSLAGVSQPPERLGAMRVEDPERVRITQPGPGGNWPSSTGNKSGGGRGNAPSSGGGSWEEFWR